MTYSSTVTETKTFTLTHAKYLSSKVVTDLKRIQRLYNGTPSDTRIYQFEQEITALLQAGYLKSVIYGFQRDGVWLEPTLIYTAQALQSSNDDDPGKITPNKDVSNALFGSYLEHSLEWNLLTSTQQADFEKNLHIKRSGAPAPGYSGYVESDLNYSSGGRALARSQVRSY